MVQCCFQPSCYSLCCTSFWDGTYIHICILPLPPLPPPTHTSQHHYGINHVTLPTKTDREDLTHLLLSSHFSVDVYDGDSLILLGTAALPLRVRWNHQTSNSWRQPNTHLGLCLVACVARVYSRLSRFMECNAKLVMVTATV